MLTENQKALLKANWGDKADALDCLAIVRVYDPHSSWECYIYAMNPEDEEEIWCILRGFNVQICRWFMSLISLCYNSSGEPPMVDTEFRPREVEEIYKKLMEIQDYERGRD